MLITTEAQIELKKAPDAFNNPVLGLHWHSTQGFCGPAIQIDFSTQGESGQTLIPLNGIDFFVSKDFLHNLKNFTIEYGWNGFIL